jgi:hypothetical protein
MPPRHRTKERLVAAQSVTRRSASGTAGAPTFHRPITRGGPLPEWDGPPVARVRQTLAVRSRLEDQQPSRRGVLAAAVGAVAAYPMTGCGLFGDDEKGSPAPDPLAPLLAEALWLAGQHEAAMAAFPVLAERLTPVALAHREHAAALARVVKTPAPSAPASAGGSASPGAPTGDAKSALAALRAAEQKNQKSAGQACQAAPAERAALLGSIAAACATHLEVVR